MFDSSSRSNSVIANSSKLKDLVDVTIFLKPDKIKKEIEEFKRFGDKKHKLHEKYPRVDFHEGVLTMDGLRYQISFYTDPF